MYNSSKYGKYGQKDRYINYVSYYFMWGKTMGFVFLTWSFEFNFEVKKELLSDGYSAQCN